MPARTGKDRKRNLTLLDESLLEEFMSIFSIGLPECLKKMDRTQRAEQGLFSLAMGYLSKKDFDKSFRHAMGLLRRWKRQTGGLSFMQNNRERIRREKWR